MFFIVKYFLFIVCHVVYKILTFMLPIIFHIQFLLHLDGHALPEADLYLMMKMMMITTILTTIR